MEKDIITATVDDSTAGKRKAKAHVLAFITILIWGNAYIATKKLLIDFSPTEIMFFRFIIAYLALLAAHPRPIRFRAPKEELLFAAAGLCGVPLYFILQNTSLVYTLASNAGVLVAVAPFFTAIFSWFLLKGEPLHRNFFVGFLFSMIGVVLISFNGNFVLNLNPLGDFMAIACAVVWAGYSVIMKKISGLEIPVLLCTRKVFFYGILTMIPMLPFLDFRLGLARFTDLPNVFNMLFLGLGASALCFVTWNFALGVLGAVRTSVYIYFNPVVTVIISILILHERITLLAVAGVVFILFGLYLSERRNLERSFANHESNGIRPGN